MITISTALTLLVMSQAAGQAVADPRAQAAACVKNEIQIGLAIRGYVARHGSFPPAFSRDKAGKPLLSWRVLILPYMGQSALYDRFHLDEPWHTPPNKALIAKMPTTYRCPSQSVDLRQGKTRYLAARGKASIFPGTETVKIRDVTDSASNTIMVVDAGDANAVIWTKPDDWEVDPDPDTRAVFSSHAARFDNGSYFIFADGSVRFLHETTSPRLLRALLTRNGGEILTSEDK